MAKVIKYKFCSIVKELKEIYAPNAEEPTYEQVERQVFRSVTIPWSERNEKIAKKEAYNGEYAIEDDGKQKPVAEQIAELKNQLSATDYKVIKCSECQLLGQEMPYDVAELHAERQAIRDEINRLEQED